MGIQSIMRDFFPKDKRFWQSLCFSSLVHIIILFLVSLFLLPPSGRPDAGFIHVALETSQGSIVPENSMERAENNSIEETAPMEEYNTPENFQDNIQEIKKSLQIPDSEATKRYLQERQENIQRKKEHLAELVKNQNKIHTSVQVRGQYGTLVPHSFYGVRIISKHTLFALDVSASMGIEDGKKQLKNAYKTLSPEEYFNLVTYAENIECWKNDLVPATQQNIADANTWVDSIQEGGATNLHGALEAVLCKAYHTTRPEIVYIISDGLATCGSVQHDLQILADVRKWNHEKNIILYVIGLGHHQNRYFLQKLAQDNYGKYFER